MSDNDLNNKVETALLKEDFKTLEKLIKETPKLVNFVDSEERSVLMNALDTPKEALDFIFFIIDHPLFELHYHYNSKKSNINSILSSDPTILSYVISKLQKEKKLYAITFYEDKLTYQFLKSKYDHAVKMCNKYPNDTGWVTDKNHYEKMKSMIYKATLDYDKGLINQLKEIDNPLDDEKENLGSNNSIGFFNNKSDRDAERAAACVAMQEWHKINAQIQEEQLACKKKSADIYYTSAEKKMGLFKKVENIVNPSAPTEQVQNDSKKQQGPCLGCSIF